MNNKELKDKLIRLSKLRNLIDTKVKDIYHEHGELTIACAEEILKRKGGTVDGMLRASVSITFKDVGTWTVEPNYMKDGQFVNVMWKPTGVHAFSVNHLPF
jgi:hypothetical protein